MKTKKQSTKASLVLSTLALSAACSTSAGSSDGAGGGGGSDPCGNSRYSVIDAGDGSAGSGLVQDKTTGLTWMRYGGDQRLSQPKAIAYCSGRGMRLPTKDEAVGIVGTDFGSCVWPNGWATWTSTVAMPGSAGALMWGVDSYGDTQSLTVEDNDFVLCVKGAGGVSPDGGSACVSWRSTGACSPSGPREPQNDLPCSTVVQAASSGYCECSGGNVPTACGHAELPCDQVCKKGSWVTSPSACLHFSRSDNCVADQVNGQQDPCTTVIQNGTSGLCMCASATIGVDCNHSAHSCNDVCAAGTWPP